MLSSFESGFAPILTDLTGCRFPIDDPTFLKVWDWPEHYLTLHYNSRTKAEEMVGKAWEIAKSDEKFWLTLKPYAHTRNALARLQWLVSDGHEVYFITSRPGVFAKRQTEMWLQLNGFRWETPTVIVSWEKGLVAAGVNLDVFVDDKPDNLLKVRRQMGTRCSYYIVDYPYNRKPEDRQYCTPITHIGQMLDVYETKPDAVKGIIPAPSDALQGITEELEVVVV